MSEQKTKKITTYVLPQEKTINLEVSGQFYKRLTGVYFNYIKKLPTEKTELFFKAIAKKEIDKLKTGDDQVDAYSLETLLIFMSDIELLFKEAGLIKEKEIEIPIED